MMPEPEVVNFAIALDVVLERMDKAERKRTIREMFKDCCADNEIEEILNRYEEKEKR